MAERFIIGADVSSLIEVEECGGKFYDNGVCSDAVTILGRHGVKLLRLRLWNDPYDADGNRYGAGTNDLPRTAALAKRAKENSMEWMLDFHYSDFWTDPGKQTMPKAWVGLSADELEKKVYDYTFETIKYLIGEGVPPQYVAVGNELTSGLLWPHGKTPKFDNIVRFLNAALKAVRDSLPQAKTVVHLDNGGNNELYRTWFDNYFSHGGDDFDIIGLSYYPFWHGKMADLANNMNDIAKRYSKDLLVVETAFGFTLDDYSEYEGLSADMRKGAAANEKLASVVEHPMTKEGQIKFLKDLAEVIKKVPEGRGKGFVYWEPAWIPVKGSGWAEPAGLEYTGEKGPGGNEWANQALFDYCGNALPALYELGKI